MSSYAETFAELWALVEGAPAITSYDDVLALFDEDTPAADELERFAYVLERLGEGEPPMVKLHTSMEDAVTDADSDLMSPNSDWPLCILDLQEGVAYSANVSLSFRESRRIG